MKKILFLIDSLPGGGAEKVLCDIVENLEKSQFDITVMTSLEGGIYVDTIKKYIKYKPFLCEIGNKKTPIGTIIYKIQKKIWESLIQYIPAKIIHKIFIGNKFDIEIAFLEGHATKIIGSSNNKKSKKLAWVHTDLIMNNWPIAFYSSIKDQRKIYNNFDSIYCVSNQVKNAFEEVMGRKHNVFTFYNPINTIRIRELANDDIDIKFSEEKFNLITVGRLIHQKGYDRLLSIYKRLIDDGLECHLYILGEGSERSLLEQFVQEKNLREKVTFLGFNRNPYKYMKKSDLFVCSSRAEGYSLVVAEALTLGTPVISTSCSGPCELLGFGEFGMITENNDQSLYEGLREIIMNPKLRNYYKKQALKRSDDFKLEQSIKNLEDILNN